MIIEYDSKYVTELQKMLDVFNSLSEYFVDDTKEKLLTYQATGST